MQIDFSNPLVPQLVELSNSQLIELRDEVSMVIEARVDEGSMAEDE